MPKSYRSRPAGKAGPAPAQLFNDLPATVTSDTLTDGSEVHSVVGDFAGVRLSFSCTSVEHAQALCESINDTVYVDRLDRDWGRG